MSLFVHTTFKFVLKFRSVGGGPHVIITAFPGNNSDGFTCNSVSPSKNDTKIKKTIQYLVFVHTDHMFVGQQI